MSDTINIAGIMDDSIVDGPGIRTAIFAQGCPRRCAGCHNPESHAFGVGTDITAADLFARVKRNPLVRGVTFSGGEPFSQAEGFLALAHLLKPAGYEIASYSGYTFEELQSGTPAQQALLAALDVLVDGEFIHSQRNLDLRFRGSENQR
ncbi:MAG: anaerobic ribonucleoside-triphosphate reductase activating protein, partial [Ruthenibacterium sp.]